MTKLIFSVIAFFILLLPADVISAQQSLLTDSIFEGIKLRPIGPAFKSGRIADIAIDPEDESVWYVAVGSGGVWKTVNAGVTWKPIFDDQSVYSIGCVTIDPNDRHTIWVGTGENVGGRHVGFGDGIYRSKDGGQTWKNMGLKHSEHISKIIVHPDNSDVLWVAVQGPLWTKGGQRGLYHSDDGGKTWNKTLGDDAWTGVTDIVMDPRNPDVLYAATWQRHRTVAAYMGGGPGSGIHKSTDGGKSWTALKKGLPKEWMGKIGLAISPQKPDIVYAAIELQRRTGGVYRSADGGQTWEKRSDAVAGATGPHYYQELYASPHHFERLYLVDVRMQVSEDGGKTFYRMNEKYKHSDNHAIAFKKDDPNYILVGTDGGLYESYDLTKTWRYFNNLPVTQYYKVAVDDTAPFYNIFGGTQDNNTQGGPSRTDNVHGITNADWKIVLNWDGHQPATEPGNPDIMYGNRQGGNLCRIDMVTGEVIDIQPQAAPGEDYERFNWDSPILVSPHQPTTIYYGSQRLWKSENRGDDWEAISPDLTRNENRMKLPIMGGQQPYEAPWDINAMSTYNTITSIAESPLESGLIYTGTDDGIIQITENGGQDWRKIDVSQLPGVPKLAFVNDIKADLHDKNTVYVALDNHKYGDYKPYILKSTDRGNTWKSISANLPDTNLVWRIVQDHVDPDLFFLATEFGLYYSPNGAQTWIKLKGNVPTISFRDLVIQKRENDLVAASFGRGFFILDDYSFLRNIDKNTLQKKAVAFQPRDAWWYIPRAIADFYDEKGDNGHGYYTAPNPPYGAVFKYYLKDKWETKKAQRLKQQKKSKEYDFSGWDSLTLEYEQLAPEVYAVVKNANGKAIRKIIGSTNAGFNQIVWDLRYPTPYTQKAGGDKAFGKGQWVVPGTYSIQLFGQIDGKVETLSEAFSFQVKPLHEPAIKQMDYAELSEFWRTYEAAMAESSYLQLEAKELKSEMEGVLKMQDWAAGITPEQVAQINKLHGEVMALYRGVHGNPLKQQIGENEIHNVASMSSRLRFGMSQSTYGPTGTHKKLLSWLNDAMDSLGDTCEILEDQVEDVKESLHKMGAPMIED